MQSLSIGAAPIGMVCRDFAVDSRVEINPPPFIPTELSYAQHGPVRFQPSKASNVLVVGQTSEWRREDIFF